MTREEAIKMLKAKRHCIELDTRGVRDCNEQNCDNCSYNYEQGNMGEQKQALDMAIKALEQEPCENMGEVSDGYHTFNQLYHQRAVLFATIVNNFKHHSWKSLKHEDGKYCFDSNGKWFIVGIDTPKGSYTYHYETDKYWNMFDCEVLECGKHWDGHTEEDVTRLLSLEQEPCDDCVSRQAALDAVRKNTFRLTFAEEQGCEGHIAWSAEAVYSDVIEGELLKLTSVAQKTKWIPVSERLPEDRREVLVTAYWHETYQVMMASYFGDGLWWCVPFNNCGEHMQRLKPRAWMPLPEPYKESEEKELMQQ